MFYTPAPDEAVWAQERTDADEHLLAMTVLLKSFQRMGRFPKLTEVPEAVIDHVRRCLELIWRRWTARWSGCGGL